MKTPVYKNIYNYIKPHKWVLIAAMVCMVFNAFATGAYAYLIGPVVKYFFTGEALEIGGISSVLQSTDYSAGIITNNISVFILPSLILIAALLKGISQFGKFLLMGVLGERSVFSLREEILKHIHKFSFKLKDNTTGSELITRMVSDMTMLQESITNAIGSLIADSLKIMVLLVLAVYLDWRLSVISFVVLPLVAVPITKVGKRLKKTSTACQINKERLAAHIEEDSNSFALIKNYLLSKERADVFNQLNQDYYNSSMKSYRIRALASPVMEMMGALGLAGTIGLAGSQIANGNLLPENFISFFAAVLMFYEPMKNLGRLNTILQSGRVGAERIFQIFEWETEEDSGEIELDKFREKVDFSNVSLSFNGREILRKLDFSITKGESLAIIGASGVGKTTLFRLLLRHYEPTGGSISIDSVNIQKLKLSTLRSLVTMVEQRPVIFNATLWENIRIAKNYASEEEVRVAIKMARLTEFVNLLPFREQTLVGERGMMLSEGEKQRIALARAFLRESDIVILDEVTSALDSENEQAIREAIEQLAKNRTVIVIAHRLSTIQGINKIIVLDNGSIAEIGTHDELLAQNGLYSKYWNLQA